MELDVQVEPQPLDGVAPSSISQPVSSKDGGKDPERFYCPYPGCNRSFAELWRLKVHFRAPPDIRGSGKERGHGTELTHCPKCGKTLKPGKHHVGCSGSKTNARQANKRTRVAGEADLPDDALATSPSAKQLKVEVEGEPLASSWQDYARSHGSQAIHHVALPASMKQEQQEWPTTIQPGIIYGPNGTATACWLPGQVNGFVPQLQAQGFSHPHFSAELQFAGSSHGYPQQLPPGFPSLSGSYSQPGLQGLSEAGQVLSLPPGGTLQQLTGVPGVQPGGLTSLNPVIFHQQQQPHDASSLMQGVHPDPQAATQQQQLLGSGPGQHPLAQQVVGNHPHPHQHQQQQGQQPHQPSLSHPPGSHTCDAGQSERGAGVDGSDVGSGGTGGLDAAAEVARGTSDAAALTVGGGSSGSGSAAASQPQQPAKATDSGDSLGSVFGDVEEFTRDFGRIPSPPPLPADFHSASSASGTGPGGMLFNFAQFGQKLPRSQSHTRLDRNLSAMGLSVESGLGDGDLLYDHTDDGDLMQLLFGIPDELPTMATIHLHKWSNEEDEDERGAAARMGPASSHPLDTPPQPPGDTTATTNNNTNSNQNNALGDRSGSQTPPQLGEQSQLTATRSGEQQGRARQPQPHGSVQSGHQWPLNGKLDAAALGGADAHLHANGAESYLAHDVPLSAGGNGSGGKAALAPQQLVNGIGAAGHMGDEHHRDHLLDAETFRLLQSCD